MMHGQKNIKSRGSKLKHLMAESACHDCDCRMCRQNCWRCVNFCVLRLPPLPHSPTCVKEQIDQCMLDNKKVAVMKLHLKWTSIMLLPLNISWDFAEFEPFELCNYLTETINNGIMMEMVFKTESDHKWECGTSLWKKQCSKQLIFLR